MTAERQAKLTLRVGEKEVCFEGAAETVAAELHRVAAAMLGTAKASDGETASLTLTAPRQAAPEREEPTPGDVAPSSPGAARLMSYAALDRRRVARLYAAGDTGALALKVLPATGRDSNADALLLLLYGLLILRGQSRVSALALLRCARDSGLALSRANRYFKGRSRWVTSSGERRNTRFQLTESGVEHCEMLIPGLLPPP